MLGFHLLTERTEERGSAVVELALCLPLLMAVVTAGITLVNMGYSKILVERFAAAATIAYMSHGTKSTAAQFAPMAPAGMRVRFTRDSPGTVRVRLISPYTLIRFGPEAVGGQVASEYRAYIFHIDPPGSLY